MIFNVLKHITKTIFTIGILFLATLRNVSSMNIESSKVLESIRSAKLNAFNLKKVIQGKQLEATRIEYERALVSGSSGRPAMLDRYNVSIKAREINGVATYEYIPKTITSEMVGLYIHGGAFVLLSAASSYGVPIQVASLCGIRVVSIDYGLAPENKYSSMVAQARLAAEGILSSGCAARNLIFFGESAGGAICISAAYQLSKISSSIGKVVLFSPWIDLSCASISDDVDDPVLRKENYLEVSAQSIVGGEEDLKLFPLSLTYDDVFPDVLIQYGTKEILAKQIRHFGDLLKKSMVNVSVESYSGLWHVFHSYSDLPETQQAFKSVQKFVVGI